MAKKTVLKALVTSALSLLLSSSMLVGATFAWFTDLAESKSNIIQTGTLQIGMYWSEGDLDVPTETSTSWADASKTAIFDNKNWAPGYFEAKHIKIANEGSLDFKWQMRILANGVVSKLAEAIDVYYFEDAQKITSASLVENKKLGTLSQVLNNTYENAISAKVKGTVSVEEKFDTVTLAFKMQDDAGNQYQNLSIGTDFSVQILATQYGNGYDNNSEFGAQETPSAMVKSLAGEELDIYDATSGENLSLDTGYQFEPTETYKQAIQSEKRYWVADFAVSADSDVAANSMMLAGYYKLYADYIEDQTGEKNAWVGLTADEEIKANTEIRLLEAMGFSVNYEELCNFGNDGTGFRCGAKDMDDSNAGTTLTVELRLYETYPKGECQLEGHENCGSTNCETGDYITIGTFTYTFGGEYVTAEDGAVFFMGDNGDMVLSDTANVTATEYNVPEGVTAIGDYAFTNNTTIKDVVLPETVTELGRAFDQSHVKKVVLNEGLEQIDSRAFRETYELETVVIPSTVKTIADNAFQKSYIEEIVIPATVETIGETAFGASKLKKVTIEGNTSIQGYAFRGCPDLEEVYLNGDNVTFIASTLNGRNSTWFCNGESGNPNTSNITFYVKNDTVAARVKAAMGAEANNTPVYVNGLLYNP